MFLNKEQPTAKKKDKSIADCRLSAEIINLHSLVSLPLQFFTRQLIRTVLLQRRTSDKTLSSRERSKNHDKCHHSLAITLEMPARKANFSIRFALIVNKNA